MAPLPSKKPMDMSKPNANKTTKPLRPRKPLSSLQEREQSNAAAPGLKPEPPINKKNQISSVNSSVAIRKSEGTLFSAWLSKISHHVLQLAPPVNYAKMFPLLLGGASRSMVEQLEQLIRCKLTSGIQVQDGVDFHFDRKCTSEFLKFLFETFHPQYIHHGLEIMYGQSLDCQKDRSEKESLSALSSFIRLRVLYSSSLAAEYHGQTEDPEFRDQLKRYGLYKLFLLFWVCDEMKALCLLPSDPPLFRVNAKVKSMEAMLTLFAQKWLKGDPRRLFSQLASIGYTLSTHQKAVDEVDINSKIDTSLNRFDDGIYASRWVLSLVHLSWNLLERDPRNASFQWIDSIRSQVRAWREAIPRFRFPASSTLHKATNAKLVLDILSCDVRDGKASIEHRELAKRISNRDQLAMTEFCWKIFGEYFLPQLLRHQMPVLEAEIARVSSGRNFVPTAAWPASSGSFASDNVLEVVTRWCRAVCWRFGLECPTLSAKQPVSTICCALIHFYRPQLLPYDELTLPKHVSESPSISAEDLNFVALRKAVLPLGDLPSLLFQDGHTSLMDNRAIQCSLFLLCHVLLQDVTANSAATAIQLFWKRHQTRRICRARTMAAMTIQKHYRCYAAAKRYHRQRQAAITLQAALRCYLVRSRYVQLRSNTIKMQARVRSHLQVRRFQRMKDAAITLQTAWRRYHDRRAFLQLKGAALMLQASRRSCVARRAFLRQKQAAVTIQACFRAYLARHLFVNVLRPAAIRIQSTVRMFLARLQYRRQRHAAIRIQAFVRGLTQRRTFLKTRQQIIQVQALTRRFLCHRQFQRIKSATIRLQAAVRRDQASRRYLQLKQNTVRIQAWFRMVQQRQHYRQQRAAALQIQRNVRRYLCRRRYLQQRQAAIRLQAVVRQYQARRRYLLLKRVTTQLQARRRGVVERQRYRQLQQTAIFLQSLVRAKQARQRYVQQRHAIIKIQAFFKGARIQRAYQTQRRAALRIQTWFRSSSARNRFTRLREAAVVLQARARQVLMTRQYQRTRESLIRLQANIRMAMQRRAFLRLRESTIRLQAAVRRHLAQTAFQRQKMAAIRIQTVFRRYHDRTSYLRLRQAAIVMQSYARMQQARRTYLSMKQAAIVIQARVRGWQQRQHFLAQKRAAILLQSVIRRHLQQQRYQRLKAATITLQAYRRAAVVRSKYLQARRAAIILQKHLRGHLQHQKFLKMRAQHRAAIKIQAAFRGMKVRQLFLHHCAATLIQSVYRGYLIRKQNKIKK